MAEDLSSQFKWPEYVVFVLVLVISAGIGVFYAFFGRKKGQSTEEFLMASRSMSTFPMAMSLVASFLSAIALLGNPAEIYIYGTQYWFVAPAYALVFLGTIYIYLPVFYKMQVTSAYEYLEMRFSYRVRIVGGMTFTIQMVIYMAMVVYAPALALSQGINTYYAVTGIFVVCIFYTAIGGMKAVMWTDTFQVVVMFVAMIAVLIKGYIDVGGGGVIWDIAEQNSRIDFWNWSFDPRVRHTVWGVTIGYYFTWLAIYGVNQSQVQRYLTVPTMKQAVWAIWLNGIGIAGMMALCCYLGLVMFAKYHKCDPLASGQVKTTDQILPLFVMEVMSDIPGLSGLFVAGVFSGALSTVSSGLNSLAAIATEDVVKYKWSHLSDERLTLISKLFAVVFGIVSFALVFVIEQMSGGVITAALSIFGMVGGPLLGVFTLGMCFPWANATGAFYAIVTSLAFMMWLMFGAQLAIGKKQLVIPKLPVSVEGCPGNLTLPETPIGETGGILEFYRVSYIWYSMIGCFMTIFLGLTISFLTTPQDPRDLNPDYISPNINKFINWVLPKSILRKIKWEIGSRRSAEQQNKDA